MINVDIYITSLDKVMDFQLDENARVYQIVQEISEMLCKYTKEPLTDKVSDFMLCFPKKQRILFPNMTLVESGIVDGSRLILV